MDGPISSTSILECQATTPGPGPIYAVSAVIKVSECLWSIFAHI